MLHGEINASVYYEMVLLHRFARVSFKFAGKNRNNRALIKQVVSV
jgi:hypothetical protein